MPRGSNTQLEIYLRMMYPWEREHLGLFKCVTWTWGIEKDTNRVLFANYAAQDYDGVMRLIETRAKKPGQNVYVGLGTQRMAATTVKYSADGYPKAIRKLNNIVSMKGIWLDLDVKPGAYANTSEALKALNQFNQDTGLPPLSMVVLSGTGGAHAYWCTKDPMPVEAWSRLATALRDHALARGLMFDPQVTVNAAGILRPPSTLNYKHNPAGDPVLLLEPMSTCKRYTYEELAEPLAVQVLAGAKMAGGGGTRGMHTQNFTSGVESAPAPPIDDVAINCGVISDVLARGGNGDSEPLWNLGLMLASFTADPVDAAHRMSKGDPRYVPAETDRKLQDKVNARAANPNIGWPQCVSFSQLHNACRTCQFFPQNKSPLYFAPRPQPTPPPPQYASGQDPLLPVGFWRETGTQLVCTNIEDTHGNALTVHVLGTYPIHDAAIEVKDGQETGHLAIKTTIRGIEKWGDVNAASAVHGPAATSQALAHAGLYVPNPKLAKEFLVAWMTRLQEMKRIIKPAAYGWTADGGFTYGEVTYRESGEEVAFRGSSLDRRFMAKGELKPWQDSMALAYGNPAMETLVATAFAAPLVSFVGSSSLVLSAYSPESGAGKTTALMLAQSVWGDPRAGMSSLADTLNSVFKKVQDLRSLPVYWDELRTSKDLDEAIRLVFQITQGKGKSRLTRDSQQMEANAFTTMFLVASNYGIAETVYHRTVATQAGGLRVFEMQVPPIVGSRHSDVDARRMLRAIENNYGVPGRYYAEFLAKNRKVIAKAVDLYSHEIEKRYAFAGPERFWSMTMATLIMGATLANQTGMTRFDLPRIIAYLEETLSKQRTNMESKRSSTLSHKDGTVVLHEMLGQMTPDHVLFTDIIPYVGRRGKPPVVKAIDPDFSRLREVWIQVGEDGRYRICKMPFDEWMRKHGYNPDQIVEMLRRDYVVSIGRQSIGVGIQHFKAKVVYRECVDLTPLTAPGSSHDASST